jgi:aryl-alcohol dehydrogenase-like predicted oxidoreductase
MKLKKKRFGRTDYRVSELCLSTSNFTRYASQDESIAILDAFREAGGNLVQTSGICPGVNLGDGFLGMPEELLGRWLKDRRVQRESIVIATRIALTRPVIGGLETYTELIRQCVEDSIRRIGCRYLDFLVVEWTDAIVPVGETIAAFEAVVASGEIRHIVPANFPPWRTLEALGSSRTDPRTVAGLEIDYSPAVRTAFETGAAKLCADHGLGVIARSPIAGGHLASRRRVTRFGALRSRGHPAMAGGIWPALATSARTRRRSPAQIALAWVLAHSQVSSVLVSVSSRDQLRELLGAIRLTLTSDDIARLGGRNPCRNSNALAS